MNWIDTLPIVLTYMRMRQRNRVNISPYEILFGHLDWEWIQETNHFQPHHFVMMTCYIIVTIVCGVVINLSTGKSCPS